LLGFFFVLLLSYICKIIIVTATNINNLCGAYEKKMKFFYTVFSGEGKKNKQTKFEKAI